MTSGRRQRRDPSDLSIEDAAERWLGRRRGTSSESTIREYAYRLRRFLEWADTADIETVGELHPLDFDDYLAAREAEGVKPLTVSNDLATIRRWVEFLESLGAVPDDLSDAVPDIDIPKGAEISDTMLDVDEGDAIVRFFRTSTDHYGTRLHALMELFWFTGCRLGAARSLDLRDLDLDHTALEFVHRPDQNTPLKNGEDGERAVAIPDETAAALRTYIDEYRTEVRDKNGRRPVFTTYHGRPSTDTVRCWTYQATQPCLRMDCPHGKQRDTCDWTKLKESSKCPSVRSPHEVRTGAITRMLNRTSKDRVEHRANTTQFDHYDMAAKKEKMEQRDRQVVPDIELDTDSEP